MNLRVLRLFCTCVHFLKYRIHANVTCLLCGDSCCTSSVFSMCVCVLMHHHLLFVKKCPLSDADVLICNYLLVYSWHVCCCMSLAQLCFLHWRGICHAVADCLYVCDLYQHGAPAELCPCDLFVLCLESLHALFINFCYLDCLQVFALFSFHTLAAALNQSRCRRFECNRFRRLCELSL